MLKVLLGLLSVRQHAVVAQCAIPLGYRGSPSHFAVSPRRSNEIHGRGPVSSEVADEIVATFVWVPGERQVRQISIPANK